MYYNGGRPTLGTIQWSRKSPSNFKHSHLDRCFWAQLFNNGTYPFWAQKQIGSDTVRKRLCSSIQTLELSTTHQKQTVTITAETLRATSMTMSRSRPLDRVSTPLKIIPWQNRGFVLKLKPRCIDLKNRFFLPLISNERERERERRNFEVYSGTGATHYIRLC